MEIFDLSWNQKKLYLYHRLYPLDPAYNLSFLYKIEGPLNIEKLKSSLYKLFRSNSIFSTYFIEEKGVPKQVYEPEFQHRIKVIDFTNEQDYEAKIYNLTTQKNNTAIDIYQLPLYEVCIYKISEETYYISMHIAHIIADGFSYYTFLEDLSILYNEEIECEERAGFFETSLLVANEELTIKAKDFFKQHLNGLEDLALKEIDECRTTEGLLVGSSATFSLTEDITEKIREFINIHKLTEFTFFLTCYALFLKKITNKDLITVGIPLPNRRKRERKKVFGYFVNTLPLSIDCKSDKTFLEICQEIKANSRSLLKHQDFNISEHYSEILEGSLGTHEINNAFTYYKQELSFDLVDCSVQKIPLQLMNIKFPFSMNVEDGKSKLTVNIEFASKFNHINFEGVFQNIYQTILKEPKILVENLELLSKHQSEHIYNIYNQHIQGKSVYKLQNNIYQAFESICEVYPDRVAVTYLDEKLTYKELNQLSTNIASNLVEMLDDNQTNVIISLPKNENLIAAILGVLKAGKTYIPIDPNAPKDRFQYILESIENPVIITKEILPIETDNCVIHIKELMKTYNSQKLFNVSKNEVAYIIYTSGSTGKPKGVQVTHQNVIRLFAATNSNFNFSEKDTWTLFHSYAFDFSVWEIFGALLYGGKLVIVPDNYIKSTKDFYELLKREKLTILNQTPSAFRQLIKVDQREKEKIASLRAIIFGGEKLDFAMLKTWVDKYGLTPRLINMYGITETTVHVSYYEIEKNDVYCKCGSIIGKPIEDMSILIVNKDMQLCPIGITGEMIVGGEGVSKGYFKQNELTKERFIKLPGREGRYYKTGDLARYLPNGRIEYLNRKDKQVQLRGFRIEIEEIEYAINSLQKYKECIVTMHKFSKDDKRLIAYIITSVPLDIKSLKEELQNKLPSYMIPSHFIEVEEIPLTINGKVDFGKLPNPTETILSTQSGTEVMKKVRDIWSLVLKNNALQLDDNFFDVGGTSLHVTEIYYKLVDEFALDDMKIIDLFEYTTIRNLANYIEQLKTYQTPQTNRPKQANRQKRERIVRRKNHAVKS
ncbi:amino acid adenylation domain-containing protein [Viridibacillus sp. NPDC096237]|uniref:amino acid adenylation domain-containing protein n=1 Tax=Viridibacillus sp. NPDC096237 TaxID=3390721 RepID=UPI003D04F750